MGLRSRRGPISRGLLPQVSPQRAAAPAEPGLTIRQTNIQRFGSTQVGSQELAGVVGGYVKKQEEKGIRDAETFLLENPEVYTRALDFTSKNPGTDGIKKFLQSGELKEEDAPSNARYLQTALARRAFRDFRSSAVQGLQEFNLNDNPQADPQLTAAKILADSFEGTLDNPVFEDFIGSTEFGKMRSAFESEFMAAATSQIRKQQVEFNKGEFRQEVRGRVSTAQREVAEGRSDFAAAQGDLEQLYQQSRALFNDSRVEFWKALEGSLLASSNDTPERIEEALRYAHSALGNMETKPGLLVSDDQADAGRGRTNAEEFSALVDKLEDRKTRLQDDGFRDRGLKFDQVKNDASNLLFPALADIDEGPASERTSSVLELRRETLENYQGPDDLRGQFTEYVQKVTDAALRREAVGSEQIKFQALNILNRKSPAEAQAYLEANLGSLSGQDLFSAQSAINEAKEFSKYLHRHDSVSSLDALTGSLDNAGSGLPREDAARIQVQAADLKGQLLEDFRQRLVNGNVNDEAFLADYNKDLRAAVQTISQSVSQSAAQARQDTISERQKVLDFHGGNLPVGPGVIDGLNLPDEEKQALKVQNGRIRDNFSSKSDSAFQRLTSQVDIPGDPASHLYNQKIEKLRAEWNGILSQGSETSANERINGAYSRALPLLVQSLTGVSSGVQSKEQVTQAQARVKARDSFINQSPDEESIDFTQLDFYQEGVLAADALAQALAAPPQSNIPGAPPGAEAALRWARDFSVNDRRLIRSGLEGDRSMKSLSNAYAAMGETPQAKKSIVSYLSVSGFRLEEIERGYIQLQGKDILDSKQIALTPDLFISPETIHIQMTTNRLAELEEDAPRLKRLLDTIGHPSDEANAKKFISTQNRWISIRKSRP